MQGKALRRIEESSHAHLIPVSGDLDEFVARVASSRGRPITLMSIHVPDGAPSGLWIATARHDYIVYPDDADPQWKSAIICHEIAHMMLGHDPEPGTSDLAAIAASAAPNIDPAVAARFLRRHGYAEAAEAAAEQLGTRLTTRLSAAHTLARVRRDRVFDRMR
jgi:hypothetical protein